MLLISLKCTLHAYNLQQDSLSTISIIKELSRSTNALIDSNPKLALQLAIKAEKLSSHLKHSFYTTRSLLNLSLCHNKLGNLDLSLHYAQLSLASLSGNKKDDTLVARVYANIANSYFKKSFYDSAINYQLKSLKIREELGLKRESVASLYNLGAISEAIGDSLSAYKYFNSSLKTAKKLGDNDLLGLAYEGMAAYYYSTSDYYKSIVNYNKSIEYYKRSNNKIGIAGSLLNLGNLQDEVDKSELSIVTYKQALQLFEELGLKENILLCYINLGITYLNEKKFEIALSYNKKAEHLAKEVNSLSYLKNVYANLSETYERKGDYKTALDYHKRFSDLKDSVLNLNKLNYINELQVKYEKNKKEQEISNLNSQTLLHEAEIIIQKRKNNILQVSSGLLIIITILGTFIVRQRTVNAQEVSEKNEQLYKRKINEIIKEKELFSVNAIMEGQESERKRIAEDLHDRLGSMLATVKLHFNALESKMTSEELLNMTHYQRVNNLLDEVCEEVRKIAHNMESGVLLNFGLVPALLDLKEALERSSEIKIIINSSGLNERFIASLEISLYRIIQELITNVIKHAHASEINIDFNIHNKVLTLLFSDNGKGYNTDDTVKGMGLKNIISRVSKLEGRFYVDSGRENGTTFIIEIPISFDKDNYS